MPSGPTFTTRILAGSPLRRPRIAAAVSLAAAILVVLGIRSLANLLSSKPAAALGVFFTALGLTALSALPGLALLWYLDRRERESPWLFFGALLWGAVVATGLSALVNMAGIRVVERVFADTAEVRSSLASAAGWAFEVSSFTIGPVIEELAKGLVLLALFWLLRAEFNNLRDGIVYGGLVGLGFIVFEAAFYIMKGYITSGDAPYIQQIAVRYNLLGIGGHMLYTALFGAGLGLALQSYNRWVQVAAPLGGFLLACIAHAVDNSAGAIITMRFIARWGGDPSGPMTAVPALHWWAARLLSSLILQYIPLLLIGIALYQSAQWERRVLRQNLAGEVGKAITAEEYRLLQREPLFGLRSVPGYPPRLGRAIVQAQNELAFRKWYLGCMGSQGLPDTLLDAWRTEIAALRRTGAWR